MKSLRALVYCIERAVDGFRRHPAAASTVIGTVAVGFFLVGMVQVVFQLATVATGSWQRAHLVVYLADEVPAERAHEIRSALSKLPAVAQAEYVGAEQTMARFRDALDGPRPRPGAPDPLLAGLEPDMLPTSIEVALRPGIREVARMAPIVDRMREQSDIADVEFAGEWVGQIDAVHSALDRARTLALLFALLACVYLSGSAIATRFGPRVREASVARLFGASNAFIQAPLLLEGALQGALGAGLASVGIWLFVDATAPGIGAVLGPAAAAEMAMPGAATLVAFIASGAGLGVASTWLATRRHARA